MKPTLVLSSLALITVAFPLGCGGGSVANPVGATGAGGATSGPTVSVGTASGPGGSGGTTSASATTGAGGQNAGGSGGCPEEQCEPELFTWTEDTASRTHFNGALELEWENNLGDWLDANGALQGSSPFASLDVVDDDKEKVVAFNVTSMVQSNAADFRINHEGGIAFFYYSREASDSAKRPVLVVARGAQTTTLQAEADTFVTKSTSSPQGLTDQLNGTDGVLIRFAQSADPSITKATLQLTAAKQYGNQTLQVFKNYPHPKPQACPNVPLGSEADIIKRWKGASDWDLRSANDKAHSVVNPDGTLTGWVPKGADTGSSTIWSIPVGGRAVELYARFVLKLDTSFDMDGWGGKIPGMTNTGMGDGRAHKCAWGNWQQSPKDGVCWSARTGFSSNPTEQFGDQYVGFHTYSYVQNGPDVWGQVVSFNRPVKRNRYEVIDQRIKLNSITGNGTPNADGELSYWKNGTCVLQWTGIVWRGKATPDTLPSEFWADIYVGGTGYAAPHDHKFTYYSFEISSKLLPFDQAWLDQLNAP